MLIACANSLAGDQWQLYRCTSRGSQTDWRSAVLNMAAAILSVFSAALNKDERFSSISQLFKLVFFSPVYPPHAISPLTRPPQVTIFCLSHLPIDPPTRFLPPGWYPSGCLSFSCTVCTEIVCLMLMATRCLVCHLLESLCISMTVESLKKERQSKSKGGMPTDVSS